MGLTVIGVRHGEVHNPNAVIYAGMAGYGLSETGKAQALAVRQALVGAGLSAIYASPLDRAIQTAGIIAEGTGLAVIPDDRLYEWRHWEQWAGMTWDELRTKGREAWEAYQSDPGSVTSGESLTQLADRVSSWLSDVRRDHPDGIVVGVMHLEGLRAVLLRMLDRPARDLFQLNIGVGQAVRLHPAPDPDPLGAEGFRKLKT